MITRNQIQATPGADLTNGLRAITDYVPGAWIAHDQLHARGGHQVTWAIDGVPMPNTNIASNMGPQIDPKDIDYLEVQRGSYSAAYGDRTYGVFNAVPRTGFERNDQAELSTTLGSFFHSNAQLNFGSGEVRPGGIQKARLRRELRVEKSDRLRSADSGLVPNILADSVMPCQGGRL